jgi:hypothetical protein
VGPRAILDAVVKRNIPSPRRESNPRTPIVQPVAKLYTKIDFNIIFISTALGPTQPAIQWVPGALTPAIKRPGHEADHSYASSTELMMEWSHVFTHPYVSLLCLMKLASSL